jgi:hypothetical protein
MSDTMLFGVLKMPYEMAMQDELSRRQFYNRVQELIGRVDPLPVHDVRSCPECAFGVCHCIAPKSPQPIEDAVTHYGGVRTDEEIQSMTQEKRQETTDEKWYWVHCEGLGKTYEAPTLYREAADAFYSFEFAGIPTRQVEVICELKPPQPKDTADDADELLLRGILSSELKCWHRLTADEVQNLIAFVRNVGAKQAQQAPIDGATLSTLAGLETSITILSALVDEQRAILVDVERVCGVDDRGGPFEDGESELIDRVLAHLAMTTPSHPKDNDFLKQAQSEPAFYALKDCRGGEFGESIYAYSRNPNPEKFIGYHITTQLKPLTDDQNDAKRYRWLFNDVDLAAIKSAYEGGKAVPTNLHSGVIEQIIGFYIEKQEVDALIDAAMNSEGEKS